MCPPANEIQNGLKQIQHGKTEVSLAGINNFKDKCGGCGKVGHKKSQCQNAETTMERTMVVPRTITIGTQILVQTTISQILSTGTATGGASMGIRLRTTEAWQIKISIQDQMATATLTKEVAN